MQQPPLFPLPIPRTIDHAIARLSQIDQADDLRFLSRYIAIELLQTRAPLQGIGYGRHDRGRLSAIMQAIASLQPADQWTIKTVIDLLYDALRVRPGSGRGEIEVKEIRRVYTNFEIDPKTGRWDKSKPYLHEIFYGYVYIRIRAGRGNADHRAAKLLSIYADRGRRAPGPYAESPGVGGGILRAALDTGLTTPDAILDAWHAADQDVQSAAYIEFIDRIHGQLLAPAAAPTE